MEESTLVTLASQGDEDAFAQLVELHQTKVYSLTYRLTNSVDDALELTQETFLNAWRGLPNFHGESRFSTWLYRLATNATIDFLRKEKRRRALNAVSISDDEEDGRILEIPDHRFTPQGEAERKELQELVRQGLRQISDDHRQVLVLRELNGLSYSEIAQILQVEEGTVKSRIARARMALKKVLEQSGNFSSTSPSI